MLPWPGFTAFPIYIIDPIDSAIYHQDSKLPHDKCQLNMFPNKYVNIDDVLELFSSASMVQAMIKLELLVDNLEMPPFHKDEQSGKRFMHLNTFLVFLMVFPYCPEFQRARSLVLQYMMKYQESKCPACDYIQRDCKCEGKKKPCLPCKMDDMMPTEIVAKLTDFTDTETQTTPINCPICKDPDKFHKADKPMLVMPPGVKLNPGDKFPLSMTQNAPGIIRLPENLVGLRDMDKFSQPTHVPPLGHGMTSLLTGNTTAAMPWPDLSMYQGMGPATAIPAYNMSNTAPYLGTSGHFIPPPISVPLNPYIGSTAMNMGQMTYPYSTNPYMGNYPPSVLPTASSLQFPNLMNTSYRNYIPPTTKATPVKVRTSSSNMKLPITIVPSEDKSKKITNRPTILKPHQLGLEKKKGNVAKKVFGKEGKVNIESAAIGKDGKKKKKKKKQRTLCDDRFRLALPGMSRREEKELSKKQGIIEIKDEEEKKTTEKQLSSGQSQMNAIEINDEDGSQKEKSEEREVKSKEEKTDDKIEKKEECDEKESIENVSGVKSDVRKIEDGTEEKDHTEVSKHHSEVSKGEVEVHKSQGEEDDKEMEEDKKERDECSEKETVITKERYHEKEMHEEEEMQTNKDKESVKDICDDEYEMGDLECNKQRTGKCEEKPVELDSDKVHGAGEKEQTDTTGSDDQEKAKPCVTIKMVSGGIVTTTVKVPPLKMGSVSLSPGAETPGGDSATPGGDSATPGGDSVTATPGGDSLSATPGGDSVPATPGGDSVPATPGVDSVPATPSGDSMPATPSGDSVPATPGGDSVPATPGDTSTSQTPVSTPAPSSSPQLAEEKKVPTNYFATHPDVLRNHLGKGYAEFEFVPTGECMLRCVLFGCGQCFDTEEYAKKHVMTHDLSGKGLTCYLCDKFKTPLLRWYHMVRHLQSAHKVELGSGQLDCSYCGLSFEDFDQLDNHKLFHHYSQYKCVQCGEGLFTWKHVQKHLQECGEKDKGTFYHSCPYCHIVFHGPNMHDVHIQSHQDDGLICCYCKDDKIWDNWKNLKKHYESFHLAKESKRLHRCVKCKIHFSSLKKFRDHLKLKHPKMEMEENEDKKEEKGEVDDKKKDTEEDEKEKEGESQEKEAEEPPKKKKKRRRKKKIVYDSEVTEDEEGNEGEAQKESQDKDQQDKDKTKTVDDKDKKKDEGEKVTTEKGKGEGKDKVSCYCCYKFTKVWARHSICLCPCLH